MEGQVFKPIIAKLLIDNNINFAIEKSVAINSQDIYKLIELVFAPPIRDYRARLKAAIKTLGIIDEAIMRPPLISIKAN